MRKILLTLFLFVFSFLVSLAQKEANIWYFGEYAGLDFNSGAPVPVNNGQQLTTLEGCASIADRNTGQILFYTDGTSVWDQNNNVMPNGTGLLGNYSSTQSAIIVPQPGSTTLYYIFTVDAQAGSFYVSTTGYGGAAYSIVDMTQNGGLGDVTTKNVDLIAPTCEKITAVRHCDGEDIWVVTHQWNTNAFYAYLLTSSGLGAPVISNSGDVQYNASGDGANEEALGYMKFSPNGQYLAMCTYPWINEVQIFNFNNSTGAISNPIIDNTIVWYTNIFDDILNGLYGATFSPDNSKLYVGETGYGTEKSNVYQYNMLAGSNAAILASRTLIYSTYNYAIGALQIGPDGKIYVAKESNSTGPFDHLDVINSPNSLGAACNYVANGLSIAASGGLSEYGLPDMVESYLVSPYTTTLTYPTCGSNSTLSFTDSLIGTITASWNFGDPSSGASNTSTLQNPSHTFSASPGTYTVTVQITNNCKTDTYSQTITVGTAASASINPSSASTCNGAPTTLTASGGGTYSWSPGGASTSSLSVNPGSATTYTVTVTSSGCTATATSLVNVNTVNASASAPASVCNGQSATITASGGGTYLWAPGGATTSAISVTPPGSYTVTVTGGGGCTSTATATVSVMATPPAPTVTKSVTGDTLFCSTDASYSSYQWYKDSVIMPGKTSDTLVIGSDPSYFSVVVTAADGCTNQGVLDNRALPIELIDFNAIYNPATAGVDLYWSTASEVNNDFFTVEKTKDDINFTTVVKVKGAGTSYSLLNYYAEDDNPYIGISYYRLKQTDFNGKFEYSSLVPVLVRSTGRLQIIALTNNIEQNSIQYFVSAPASTPFTIVITDLIGKTMLTQTTTDNVGILDFSTFAHGLYFFKVFNSTGSSVRKFVY